MLWPVLQSNFFLYIAVNTDPDGSMPPDQGQEQPPPAAMPNILTVPGSHIFKANIYHTKLMKLSQKLSEVAKGMVGMELNRACTGGIVFSPMS